MMVHAFNPTFRRKRQAALFGFKVLVLFCFFFKKNLKGKTPNYILRRRELPPLKGHIKIRKECKKIPPPFQGSGIIVEEGSERMQAPDTVDEYRETVSSRHTGQLYI